ncbi:MAG: hypothetical protein E7103_14640 [Prevotella sp.]|nr:hypothetical protein [Prevotella sp.]
MKVILKSVVASLAVMSLAACSNNDLYDEGVVAANKTAEKQKSYENNFVKKYGEIDPNQTWDFTSGATLSTTRAGAPHTQVYMQDLYGLDFTKSQNIAIYNAIKTQLPDNVEKTGKKAVLIAPGNPFVIYPLTTQGSWKHTLYVKVGNQGTWLYQKTWGNFDNPVCNGMTVGYNLLRQPVKANMYGILINAPAGTRIEVYLKIEGQKTAVGTGTGNAIIVDAGGAKPEVPNGLKGYDDVKYIGIEDNINGGDKDYNDVVLAMLGYPNVPVEKPIVDNKTYTETTTLSKRYMVEDLGETDDFDFNDIVIDVEEETTTTHTVTLTDGEITSDVVSGTSKTQKAILRHRGGIYPFSVKIGNSYTSDEFPGVLSDDPNEEITIPENAWDSEANNISLNVRDTNTGAVVIIPFAMKGEVPMMVAMDTSIEWMPERKAVSKSWFNPVPERLQNLPDPIEKEEQETPDTAAE